MRQRVLGVLTLLFALAPSQSFAISSAPAKSVVRAILSGDDPQSYSRNSGTGPYLTRFPRVIAIDSGVSSLFATSSKPKPLASPDDIGFEVTNYSRSSSLVIFFSHYL